MCFTAKVASAKQKAERHSGPRHQPLPVHLQPSAPASNTGEAACRCACCTRHSASTIVPSSFNLPSTADACEAGDLLVLIKPGDEPSGSSSGSYDAAVEFARAAA